MLNKQERAAKARAAKAAGQTRASRYLPHHAWYRADADLLIRKLQAALWPAGWHVALGGGVLNHGYSDKDVDIYVLPIYATGRGPDASVALNALVDMLGDPMPGERASRPSEGSEEGSEHECFEHQLVFQLETGQRVDVFVVRP